MERPSSDSFQAMAVGSADALVRGRVSRIPLGAGVLRAPSLTMKPYAPSDNQKKL